MILDTIMWNVDWKSRKVHFFVEKAFDNDNFTLSLVILQGLEKSK